MAIALLISESYLKQFTPLSTMIDYTDLRPSVEQAQDSWLQDILGTNFYVYLQNKYVAQTLTADEVTLMNHIKPFLAYRAAAEGIPFVHYSIKNKGVQVQNGDYSAPAELVEFKYIRNELDNRSEFYAKRLSNYLCQYGNLYPEYVSDNSTDMKPSPGGYDGCDLAFF